MTAIRFKTFYTRAAHLSEELELMVNRFFSENSKLTPKSVSLTTDRGFSLTAIVMYEDEEEE